MRGECDESTKYIMSYAFIKKLMDGTKLQQCKLKCSPHKRATFRQLVGPYQYSLGPTGGVEGTVRYLQKDTIRQKRDLKSFAVKYNLLHIEVKE